MAAKTRKQRKKNRLGASIVCVGFALIAVLTPRRLADSAEKRRAATIAYGVAFLSLLMAAFWIPSAMQDLACMQAVLKSEQ